MKVIDTFTFFNELRMLELRLNVLDKYVDKFVLVEATRSHQDKPKPLYFQENKHLFERFLHKIEHVIVDTFPEHSYWSHENYQRDCIYGAVSKIAQDEDIIFISDLDEIWDPVKISPILDTIKPTKIYKWKSQICYFYFNLVASEGDWIQPMFMKYMLLRMLVGSGLTISHDILRNQSSKLDPNICVQSNSYCGWHFSYTESPTYKLQNFLHSEYANLTEDYIKDCIKKKINPFHKNEMRLIDDSYLPEYVQNNKEKYKDLILQ